MTDTKKLKERIQNKGLKYGYVASYLGITPYGLRKKIENDTEFKASEIKKLYELLDISEKERTKIFFA